MRSILLLVTLVGCIEQHGRVADIESNRERLTDAEYAAELIQTLPNWAQTNVFSGYSNGLFTSSDVATYAQVADALSGLAVTDVRAGTLIALAKASEDGYVEELLLGGNLFVLWRVLFDIPAALPTADIGWRGPHAGHAPFNTWTVQGVEYYNYQWPAVFNTSGVLTGIEPFMGARGGYMPLSDFDFLAGKYAFR